MLLSVIKVLSPFLIDFFECSQILALPYTKGKSPIAVEWSLHVCGVSEVVGYALVVDMYLVKQVHSALS